MNTDTCETECTPPSRFRMVDLFSGIGGFSLAASWVWGDDLEIVAFCEIDKFCQKILRKHWPDVPIIEDIREVTVERITTYTRQFTTRNESNRLSDKYFNGSEKELRTETRDRLADSNQIDLLTAGVPCQPASCAGKRKGTGDDRWLWPETFRVIREIKPTWCLLENVRGLATLEGGLVFENLCLELEALGYEILPTILPACAKNAPHRRDRFWFVAHAKESGWETRGIHEMGEREQRGIHAPRTDRHAADTTRGRLQGLQSEDTGQYRTPQAEGSKQANGIEGYSNGWEESWYSVATRTCIRGVDDGVSNRLHRVDRLKSLGNSIVPAVAYEILRAIKEVNENR